MCIEEFAFCEDCGFTRHYASLHCTIYLAKLYKHIGFGEGPHPDTEAESCPHPTRVGEIRIGPLACPNTECPKVLRAPELRRQMEADRLEKLLKKQRIQEAIEAYQRRFANKYFIRRVPVLPQKGQLGELVKAHKEEEKEALALRNTPEAKALSEAKAEAFRSYMLQRDTGSYANVFEDSEDGSSSLTPGSGSKTSSRCHDPKTSSQSDGLGCDTLTTYSNSKTPNQSYDPEAPSRSNELGRSLPIPIKDPGRRRCRGKGGPPPEGTDAYISEEMELVLSMVDKDYASKYKTLSGWRTPKPRSK